MREVVVDQCSSVISLSSEEVLKIFSGNPKSDKYLSVCTDKQANSLFVLPAQCNFSGVKHPLNWVGASQCGILEKGNNCFFCCDNYLCYINADERRVKVDIGCNSFNSVLAINVTSKWACLLDAASLVASSSLDLSVCKPDFVAMSFYKIFGYPTGLGALLVRNSSSSLLCARRYFGGGTVLMAMSGKREHKVRQILHERF